MENSVIFHNVKESPGENCTEKVTTLLKSKSFGGEVGFDKIHWMGRMGRFENGNSYTPHPHRPIVAQLAPHSDASPLIRSGAWLSKNCDLWITPQHPASLRENRKQLAEIAEGAKSGGHNVSTRLVSDILYINGNRYRNLLLCPTPKESLYLSDTERAQALRTRVTKCRTTEGGCTFIARAAPAQSINDVRALYKAILLNPENAHSIQYSCILIQLTNTRHRLQRRWSL